MNLKYQRRAVIAVVLAFTVVACTSTPKEKLYIPDHAFNHESKYALLWVKPCHAKLLGGCEVDDGRTTEAKLAIHGEAQRVDLKKKYENEVGLSASIARINATPIFAETFLKQFKQGMVARKMNVVAVAKPVYEGALRKRSSANVIFNDTELLGATLFPLQVKSNSFELRPIYDELDVDYLIVMELLRFTIERHYGPTGKPVSNPQAVSVVRLSVHDRNSNEPVFDDYAYKVVLTDDGWDKPPHYRQLESALTQTLRDVIAEARMNLLQPQRTTTF